MSIKRKVIGEKLVIGGFSESPKTRQMFDMTGGPGTTRTCDPLLRRPIPGFSGHSYNSTESLSTPLLAQLSEEKRPLAGSHQKQRFGSVSGEQLVNLPVSQLGPIGPFDTSILSSDNFDFNKSQSGKTSAAWGFHG